MRHSVPSVINKGMIEKTISEFLLRRGVISLRPTDTVATAARSMADNNIGCVLVSDGGRVVGIFTERDFLNRVVAMNAAGGTLVGEVMTADPATLHADDCITYAINHMAVGGFRHVPILDDSDAAVGVVDVRTVVEHLTEVFEEAEEAGEGSNEDVWTDIGGGG